MKRSMNEWMTRHLNKICKKKTPTPPPQKKKGEKKKRKKEDICQEQKQVH